MKRLETEQVALLKVSWKLEKIRFCSLVILYCFNLLSTCGNQWVRTSFKVGYFWQSSFPSRRNCHENSKNIEIWIKNVPLWRSKPAREPLLISYKWYAKRLRCVPFVPMVRIVKLLWRMVIIYQWYHWRGCFDDSLVAGCVYWPCMKAFSTVKCAQLNLTHTETESYANILYNARGMWKTWNDTFN